MWQLRISRHTRGVTHARAHTYTHDMTWRVYIIKINIKDWELFYFISWIWWNPQHARVVNYLTAFSCDMQARGAFYFELLTMMSVQTCDLFQLPQQIHSQIIPNHKSNIYLTRCVIRPRNFLLVWINRKRVHPKRAERFNNRLSAVVGIHENLPPAMAPDSLEEDGLRVASCLQLFQVYDP